MSTDSTQALQDQYAARSICFGCGPSNNQGLQIKSFVQGDRVVAHFTPEPFHHAFPGVLNGGIIGAVLDCHSNWAASWYLMQHHQLDEPPCTVTAEFKVKLRRPTPCGEQLTLNATLLELDGDKAIVQATLLANQVLCDEFTGVFVRVEAGHPAFHRW